MKPALYYALLGFGGGVRHTRMDDSDIMVVTSEKGHQVYGRDLRFGNPTHRRSEDVVERFDTEEAARAAIGLAQKAYDDTQPAVEAANEAYRVASAAQRTSVREAVKHLARKEE